MRRIVVVAILGLAVAGCGSQNATPPTPTPTAVTVADKTYTDPDFGFSFRYPGNWKAPAKGSTSAATGPNNYFVHLTVPNQAAGVEVEVSGTVTQFPPIRNGQQAKDPKGPDIFTYYHARVSGQPALRVLRSYKGVVDEVATFINVGHAEYAVRMVTPNPPFPEFVANGYNLIVRTLKLPTAGNATQ
jgi:hypothetical protein